MSDPGTIAAIATAPGAGGIGIVRLSGPRAAAIVAALVGKGETELPDRRLVHGFARDPKSGARLDEVLVVVMRGPASYTGEDVAELHGHGGTRNLARLLGAALAAGARLAEPGEFTRRAFEQGRLDLTRAEAVADIIGAASERALRAAQAALGGALGAKVEALHREAVGLLAEIEAAIDFPEEDLTFLPRAGLAERAAALGDAARALAGTYRLGHALRDGIQVALVGAPNVGKSSLLNALAEEERALVAPEPGTTRDYLEAHVVWDGVPVTLIDTAGQRAPRSEVERRGVALGAARAARADLVVTVRDASAPESGRRPAGPRELEVWNKVDLAAAPDGALAVSALTLAGLAELKRAVVAQVVGEASEGSESALVSTERQRALIVAAAHAAGRAAEGAQASLPLELVAIEAREVATRLGAILGRDVGEDMLDALFARFCVGK